MIRLAALACLALLAVASPTLAETFSMMGPAQPTQDLTVTGKPIVILAQEDFVITDLNVILSLPHEDSSQLSVRLRHPDGTAVRLAVGAPGLGFFHAVFDDEAAAGVSGTGLHTGSLQPFDPLSIFDGKNSAGVWNLQVEDHVVGGSGELRSASLCFNGMTFPSGDVPVAIPFFGTVQSALPVAANVRIADAEVTLDLDHSMMLDLRVRLLAPGGAVAKLYDSFGGAAGLHGTTFDDEAFEQIDTAGGTATGRWRCTSLQPQPLSKLDDTLTAGTWKLDIFDEDPVEGSGQLDAWSLHIVPEGPCADVAAQASSYGAGVAGTLGVPTLTPVFEPHLGEFFQLQVSNSLGAPQQGALFIGLHKATLPGKGGTLLLLPVLQSPFNMSGAGGLTFLALLPPDATLCGQHLYVQSLHADPGAPKGVAFSAGMDLLFGS